MEGYIPRYDCDLEYDRDYGAKIHDFSRYDSNCDYDCVHNNDDAVDDGNDADTSPKNLKGN